MSKYRPKSRRRKNKAGKQIKPIAREEVLILREMGLTLPEVCNKTLLGYGTVVKIISDAENDSDAIRIARAKALERASGMVMEKAAMAFDHLTPDSLKHDRIEELDDAGNLVRVHHSGATAQQIVTTGSIALDQSIKMQKRAEELRANRTETLTPETVRDLLKDIKGSVVRIKMMDVEFDASAVEQQLEQANVDLDSEPVEADYEIVDPEDCT